MYENIKKLYKTPTQTPFIQVKTAAICSQGEPAPSTPHSEGFLPQLWCTAFHETHLEGNGLS